MLRFLPSIILTLYFSITCSGQFFTDQQEFYFTTYINDGGGAGHFEYFKHYELDLLTNDSNSETYICNGLITVTNDSVYHLSLNDTVLLFDFTLSKGDTFNIPYDTAHSFIVGAIDTIHINNRALRRQYMHCYDNNGIRHIEMDDQFIEGYGSTRGGLTEYWRYYATNLPDYNPFIGVCAEMVELGHSYSLRYIDSQLLSREHCIDLAQLVSINSISDDEKQISFFPNPTTDIIRFSSNDEDTFEAAIYNSSGTLLKEIMELKDDDPILLPQEIGVYIIVLSSSSGYTNYKRVIKTN